MRAFFIVDGYNVINAWKEFARLREENLEHARDILIDKISEYTAFKGYRGIVVFDAQETPGGESVISLHGLEVVFTDEGETADSWIERRAYELGRQKIKTFVVTSDYAEQINVLGAGAYRISAREFREEYLHTKKIIAEKTHKAAGALNRNEIGGRLKDHVLAHLEELRRRK